MPRGEKQTNASDDRHIDRHGTTIGYLSAIVAMAIVHVLPANAAESRFELRFGPKGITSLRRSDDQQKVEFLRSGASLGDVVLRFRAGTGPWQEVATADVPDQRQERNRDAGEFAAKHDLGDGLTLSERFVLRGDVLLWTMRLRNGSEQALQIGDLAVPLPMNTDYPHGFDKAEVKQEIFTRRLIRHAFISGDGSFLFWLPVGGVGPHLVMTPIEGTQLEYFTESQSNYAHGGGRYTVFIHSAASGAAEKRGTWRQKHTSIRLAPGQEVVYGFELRWADDYEGIRNLLYQTGRVDVRVVPGMVVPKDLFALCALRTKHQLVDVVPEFPEQTQIDHLGRKQGGMHIYKVRFSRLGENMLTLRYGGGRHVHLEFFVTQPLETLIKKRARFIAEKQQHRDPSKWYDGLFSLWDVRMPEGQNLLGPDNLGGQHPYAVSGSDDPSNSKCLYLSEKSVVYPDRKQVAALEYFLEHFVWGKHQRTAEEKPFPFGIYGSDSWFSNRFAKRDPLDGAVSRPGGHSQCRMWRTFDYTTYFALYYNMYRIARQNPGMVRYLDAAGYLRRAFGTARAFFEVPYSIRMEGGWSFTGWPDWAYTIGNFHEKYLLPIIDAMEEEGLRSEADYLCGQWEKKVKYFLYDEPYPFISEMPVDSTAYESSYVIAKYALRHGLKLDERLWQDKNSGKWYSHPRIDPAVHEAFLRRQLLANLACRGWLETSYYHYGSDFRGCGSAHYTLSYMSQMGGWSILDHGLYFEDKPAELIRLGYGSMLSSWALLNAGTAESDYGHWYPGQRHDGAVGWGFFPQKFGHDWNPATKGIPRGAWPVDGEIDHGLAAYVETARTVVIDDPVFGLIAYGGTLQQQGNSILVVPKDGVRRRLHVVRGPRRLHLALDRDGFAENRPVQFDEDLAGIRFALESRTSGKHVVSVTIGGLPAGTYDLLLDSQRLMHFQAKDEKDATVPLPMDEKQQPSVVIKRR